MKLGAKLPLLDDLAGEATVTIVVLKPLSLGAETGRLDGERAAEGIVVGVPIKETVRAVTPQPVKNVEWLAQVLG